MVDLEKWTESDSCELAAAAAIDESCYLYLEKIANFMEGFLVVVKVRGYEAKQKYKIIGS